MQWQRFPSVKWSFQIARVAGIDVRIHATFFLLLAWFGFVYYSEGGYGAMVAGLSFIILLFACVVLHEFGHALAARAFGINTPDITLLPIGGVARLERMPDKPWQELVVAIAGPAVNIVIAIVLYLMVGNLFRSAGFESLATGQGDILTRLLVINITLVLFNLLPAFPMDGGRILRALLAMRMKHARATRIAAGIGQAAAVLIGLPGLLGGNPFLILIAVFVFVGARAEASYAVFKQNTEEMRVSQIMHPIGVTLSPGMTVAEAAAVAMGGSAELLPVTSASLHLLGIVPVEALAGALRWDSSCKIEPLVRHDFETMAADAPLAAALAAAQANTQGAFPVLNPSGQLVGMLDRNDLAGALEAARGSE